MSVHGLALLPAEQGIERIAAAQQQALSVLSGPKLTAALNLPHITIYQAPFDYRTLWHSVLHDLAAAVPHRLTVRIRDIAVVPDRLLHAELEQEPWMPVLAEAARAVCTPLLNRNQLLPASLLPGYTQQDLEQYRAYGYRYAGSAWRPHLTLGRTLSAEITTPPTALVDAFASLIDVPLPISALAVYTAGDQGELHEVTSSIPLQ